MRSQPETFPGEKKKGPPDSFCRDATMTQLISEDVVRAQVSEDRPREFQRYLLLFGYDPDRTVLRVYRGRAWDQTSEDKCIDALAADLETDQFLVAGRTYDPVCGFLLNRTETRSGLRREDYLGYLFTPWNDGGRPTHELLPLDFTPRGLSYPDAWRGLFGDTVFIVMMHVKDLRASLILQDELRRAAQGST